MIRTDIFDRTPQLNDTICWNPAKYKGLVYGKVVDFRKNNGLPIIELDPKFRNSHIGQPISSNPYHYVPKTEFVIVNHE